MRYKLSEKHPAMEALAKLSSYADDLNIRIIFYSSMRTTIEYNGNTYELLDNEDNSPIEEFPPVMEYKMVLDDE